MQALLSSKCIQNFFLLEDRCSSVDCWMTNRESSRRLFDWILRENGTKTELCPQPLEELR